MKSVSHLDRCGSLDFAVPSLAQSITDEVLSAESILSSRADTHFRKSARSSFSVNTAVGG
jgi:hypothetical protein